MRGAQREAKLGRPATSSACSCCGTCSAGRCRPPTLHLACLGLSLLLRDGALIIRFHVSSADLLQQLACAQCAAVQCTPLPDLIHLHLAGSSSAWLHSIAGICLMRGKQQPKLRHVYAAGGVPARDCSTGSCAAACSFLAGFLWPARHAGPGWPEPAGADLVPMLSVSQLPRCHSSVCSVKGRRRGAACSASNTAGPADFLTRSQVLLLSNALVCSPVGPPQCHSKAPRRGRRASLIPLMLGRWAACGQPALLADQSGLLSRATLLQVSSACTMRPQRDKGQRCARVVRRTPSPGGIV